MNNAASTLYSIMEWITRFAYMNLLWITFTLLGGILFGFYPATIAMFAIVRDWLRGKTDIPIFKSYRSYYKSEFKKGNLLGILMTIILILIGLDLFYLQFNMDNLLSWTQIPLFAFILLFALFFLYIFPVFVHFDLNNSQLIKNAFLIMLINPIHTFFMILCLLLVYFTMTFIPALFFIFGATTYAFITMWLSLHAFQRIQKKQEAK